MTNPRELETAVVWIERMARAIVAFSADDSPWQPFSRWPAIDRIEACGWYPRRALPALDMWSDAAAESRHFVMHILLGAKAFAWRRALGVDAPGTLDLSGLEREAVCVLRLTAILASELLAESGALRAAFTRGRGPLDARLVAAESAVRGADVVIRWSAQPQAPQC